MNRILLAVLVTLLGACAERESVVHTYADRLADTLGEVAEPHVDNKALVFPRKRQLAIEFKRESIGLLDFLALGECELQGAVAEKNSSLGKLATPSQLLINELKILESGADCSDLIKHEDPALAGQLDEVLEAKAVELPGRIFLATLAGDEFRAFWRNSDKGVSYDSVRAISQIRQDAQRWLAGDYRASSSVFEQQLQAVSLGNGGYILQAWSELRRELPVATRVLERRVERQPLCYPGMKGKHANHFNQVVRRYFINDIQVSLAELNRVTYELETELSAFELLLDHGLPDSYNRWRLQRSDLPEQGRREILAHVQALEPLMLQCGFL